MTSLFVPRSIKEYSNFLAVSGELEKHFIAGGTDWLIKNRGSIPEMAVLFDLSKMTELRGIEIKESYLRVGAMETMTLIHSSALIKLYAAALTDAALSMGSVQIRNRATVGGNLANASPAADTPCALAALDASATVFSLSGSRSLSIEEVLASCPNTNTLSDGEIITEFCTPVRKGYVSAFKKVGSRSEVSIARVNMAVSAKYEGGIFSDARVFVGTLGRAAIRCPGAEKALALHPSLRDQSFKSALCEFAGQMIPGRSTLPYKKSALRALAEDLLEMLGERGKASEKSGKKGHE
ncbi:MAG: FAD binding domain-containing protein [Synergistaceae bacterium]|nr:FAD binding domain-containing protein [Synergistaceae bacterium]